MHNRSLELVSSALLLASLVAFSAACGSSSASAGLAGAGGVGAGGADNGGSATHPIEIAFKPGGVIPLKPKESIELTVLATWIKQATPAAQFPIRFGLVGGDPGDPATDVVLDAVLDATEVQTDDEGLAHVTLIAPSTPTRFDVRASSTGAEQTVQQTITVSASGVTDLRVLPSYSGKRQISKWTASAHVGASCTELDGNPPPDGASPKSAKPNTPLVLSVPVGVDLAVTIRAGHYIGGCVNVPALKEGDGNQVLAYASDRALDLSATNLSLNLGATNAHPEFDKLLQASASLAESALLGSAKNDVAALLDGMRAAAPIASRDAFDTARTESAWESALETAFGKGAARRMRDPAQRWLSAGLLALNAPDALVGVIAPLSSASGATFTPTAVGSARPSDAGFPGFFGARWSADSNDTVLIDMELNWEPSRLVTALAVLPALVEVPQATTVESALSLSVGCAQVAQVLLTYGESPGNAAFASCDEACAQSLCTSAVAAAWAQAQQSSGTAIDTLSITASGAAQIGDDARAAGLSGSWVGELQTDAGATAPVSGALSASDAP